MAKFEIIRRVVAEVSFDIEAPTASEAMRRVRQYGTAFETAVSDAKVIRVTYRHASHTDLAGPQKERAG